MSVKAVFLHSSWRAGSTYVWAKFRQQSGTCCYFEPLNEHLAKISQEMIDGFRPWSFANHPALDEPYFAEFRSLIGPHGGAPGFPAHLALGRYCAGEDEHLPELEDYLNRLAAHAALSGKRPVYGFVRTDMRVSWFRARMPGAHIFIRREPRRQFLSMLRQAAQGNTYFLERCSFILQQNRDAPALAPLLSALRSPSSLDSSAFRNFLEKGSSEETNLAQLYIAFYFMRRLARTLGEAHCDLVIDIDRLSLDGSYRREIEIHLAELVDVALCFADCRVERYDETLGWSNSLFDLIEQETDALAAQPSFEAAA
jgi:hypothetical protein